MQSPMGAVKGWQGRIGQLVEVFKEAQEVRSSEGPDYVCGVRGPTRRYDGRREALDQGRVHLGQCRGAARTRPCSVREA